MKAKGRSSRAKMRLRTGLFAGLMVCAFAGPALADTISLGGQILQSTQDGTGPAANNPGLNGIQDLETYLVTLSFSGSITAAGTYDLTGATLTLSDPAAGASETAFGLISLTVTPNASFDDFSLLACLTSGSGCAFGNQLNANFRIPAVSLHATSVPATGLDQPHPLDLLEDDGITDIQGSITSYSYSVLCPQPILTIGADANPLDCGHV